MSKADHILTKDEFEKIYTTKHGFFADLFARRPSKTEVDRQIKVEESYRALLESGTALFESSLQEISQEEIDDLTQRKKKTNRTWIAVALGIGVPLIAVTFLAGSPVTGENMVELVGLFFLAIGLLAYWYWRNKNYNAVLSFKEKRVLKGVVTNKYNAVKRKNDEEAGCFLELSLHMVVQVWPKEFKLVRVGDIVQIDIFSNDFGIKPNVTKRGVFPGN